MSENREVLSDIITDRQSFTGDQVKNLRTGKTFTAEIEEVQDIELNTELGRDARESVLIHVKDRTAAEEMQSNDQVQFTINGVLTKFIITRRSDNAAKLMVEFGCRKKTAQDT